MLQPAPEHVGASGPVTARPPHNLPAALTPFVGRVPELSQVVERLREPASRLVTITGAGGAGKTRLAIEAGRALAPGQSDITPFIHGVALATLASIAVPTTSEEILATTIASALGITLSGPESPAAQVAQFTREKALLLILDNFEQALSGAAFVATLLQEAPQLTILVTSRNRLNIRGERVVELSGLPFPDEQRDKEGRPQEAGAAAAASPSDQLAALERYDAIQLFVQTAQAVEPSFELSVATAPAVARVCRMVEGLPLGIELAAAWVRVLSPDEIAHEIGQNLDFLTSSTSDLPARQQSLRAVFDYSWNLLTDAERQALRQMSVFYGSFTREAAGAVLSLNLAGQADEPAQSKARTQSAELLTLLASLGDKSLLRRVGAGSAARYEVIELLRQYAAEQLDRAGETAPTTARHARYYEEWIAARAGELRGPSQQAALAAIGAEIEQVRAAWHHAVGRADAEAIGRMAGSLFQFYDMRSWFREGVEAFGSASQALADATDAAGQLAYGKVLARYGWFTFHLGGQAEARDLLEQSLALLRRLDARAEMVFALNYLGAVNSYLGAYDQTRALCEESLAIATAIGDLDSRAIGCNILGQAAYDLGDYGTAKGWHQQSLSIEQQTGNRWSMAYSLTNLGKVAYALREYGEARQLFEQGLHTREELGDVRGVAICLNRLGDIAVAQGDVGAAGEHYAQGLALYREIGNQWGRAAALINLGRLAASQERDTAALRLLQEALRLALATQAAPQVAQILTAAAPIVRRRGDAAWAAELAAHGTADVAVLDRARPQADRLLAWSAAGLQALSLDQALAEARRPPQPTEKAASTRSTATSQPASPAAYPAGLTAREVAVLRLVAQGLTDAQVAERLVVSPRTVSTHLTSIYGKLGVGSRAAATRFAVEQGLL
jgi:predicted ATPase/DNA-binding CsgD family transcriptional regulator